MCEVQVRDVLSGLFFHFRLINPSILYSSPDHRLLAVALLDNTVKVFFADTLKVSDIHHLLGVVSFYQDLSPCLTVFPVSLWPQIASSHNGHLISK